MEPNEFENIVKKLNIPSSGNMTEDNRYIIDISNSDDYSKIYSLLDNSSEVSINPDATLLNEDINQLLYVGDGFMLKLIGNFKEDNYKLIIEETK